MERTFICLRPTNPSPVGRVIARFESNGLKLIAMKMINATRSQATEHYKEYRDRPFFNKLINYITSGPVVAMVWEGIDSVKKSRHLLESACFYNLRNMDECRDIVRHGSYNVQDAQRKINIWFSPNELRINSTSR
ncbi:hypothetical protein niasHT_038595 [Heterodera trifolii]|uniref:nucleoside-diphosphate kinase n=1 Tax=Heterodera trifolii TaxID=157864 RepID=A0ABD2I6C9_9BILA